MPNEKPFVEESKHNEFLVYPQALAKLVRREIFDVDYLRHHELLRGEARGRGVAHFFEYRGKQYILRHYYRGGVVAKASEDQYIWRGLENTRAYRELQILLELGKHKLPTAEPLAVRVERHGVVYRADIITTAISDSQTLVEYLCGQTLDPRHWEKTGAVIAAFHRAGVYHDDLNAHNILLNSQHDVFIIDFDKARMMKNHRGLWRKKNLKRLRRSLDKEININKTINFSNKCWKALEKGYSRAWSGEPA